MAKKLTLLGMAIAALAAFAIPAAASAAPVMTSELEPEVPIALESTIKGTSTNAVTTGTGVGTLKCSHVEVYGEITKNNGAEGASGVGLGGKTEGCVFGPNNTPMTVTAPTLVSLDSTSSGTANVVMTYRAHVGPVECHFEGSGTGTYVTGTGNLQITNLKLTATAPVCGGSDVTFSGTFALTDTEGNGVVMSAG